MSVSDLPVPPPVAPMLAKLERALPVGDYIYEPKWDGFRCLVFRDGPDVALFSRNDLDLTRYFPEVVEVLRAFLPERAVLDGEVVVTGPAGLDFDALAQRVHPAESRIRLLSRKTPASFVAFDVLAIDDLDLRARPFSERRKLLEGLQTSPAPSEPPSAHVTPATRDIELAQQWFERFEGAGLDGVVAKEADLAYVEGKRAMVKVKHERTAEFVVGGFRWYRASRASADAGSAGEVGGEVGSLLLGLYDETGRLSHVGVIGAFPAEQRRQLASLLAPYRVPPGAGLEDHPWAAWARAEGEQSAVRQRMPGARSRWSAKKDLSFEAVRPELVVEAAYEHLQGDRLRHTAQFRRWRPDRAPNTCTYSQLDVAVPYLLEDVFGSAVGRGE